MSATVSLFIAADKSLEKFLEEVSELFQVTLEDFVDEDCHHVFTDPENRFHCVICSYSGNLSHLSDENYAYELNIYPGPIMTTSILEAKIKGGHKVFQDFKANKNYALLLLRDYGEVLDKYDPQSPSP